MAIMKARSVLLLFKMSTQRQSYTEFKLKTIEGNAAVFLWIKQARAMGTYCLILFC